LEIRKANPEDCEKIYRMHSASIKELCGTHYTSEQIREWTEVLKPDRYIAAMDLFEFYVAEDEGEILGLCILDLDKAELNALYVAPWAASKGLGKALMGVAEQLARNSRLPQLTLKATLNAVDFYERVGYLRGEADTHVLLSGTELPCVQMKKLLYLEVVTN
jgi:putative acetyltransferase